MENDQKALADWYRQIMLSQLRYPITFEEQAKRMALFASEYTYPTNAEEKASTWSPLPMIGWRDWSVDSHGVYGQHGGIWTSPFMEATCENHPGKPVAPSCRCGIYAKITNNYFGNGTHSNILHSFSGVVGRTLLLGKVVEGRTGMRAERAYVDLAFVFAAYSESRTEWNILNAAWGYPEVDLYYVRYNPAEQERIQAELKQIVNDTDPYRHLDKVFGFEYTKFGPPDTAF